MADTTYLEKKQLEAKIRAAAKAILRRGAKGGMDELCASVRRHRPPLPSGEAERVNAILHDLSTQLTRLDRYERRALSRRKFAIRALSAMR